MLLSLERHARTVVASEEEEETFAGERYVVDSILATSGTALTLFPPRSLLSRKNCSTVTDPDARPVFSSRSISDKVSLEEAVNIRIRS
jgi:hypothetical protein